MHNVLNSNFNFIAFINLLGQNACSWIHFFHGKTEWTGFGAHKFSRNAVSDWERLHFAVDIHFSDLFGNLKGRGVSGLNVRCRKCCLVRLSRRNIRSRCSEDSGVLTSLVPLKGVPHRAPHAEKLQRQL